MWETLQSAVVAAMDALLGPMLDLPKDLVLLLVAVASAAILTGVRLFTTNQDLLGRCARDRRRLKQLTREARKAGDKAAAQRCRATANLVAMKQLRAEGLPLLAALAPIALLATWCVQRLEFLPPAAGDAIRVAAYFPLSAAGEVAHIVPQDGVQADGGWVKPIEVDPEGGRNGLATWTLRAAAAREPYVLQVRHNDRTYEQRLRVGQRFYEPPLALHDGGAVAVEVRLRPLQLLGVVPGVPALFLPPWIVAYLIIVIPVSFGLKRALHVH